MTDTERINCALCGEPPVTNVPWCCDACEVRMRTARIEEIVGLRSKLAAAQSALRQVEHHHVEINRRAGRPEERSTTLRIVRAAILAEKETAR